MEPAVGAASWLIGKVLYKLSDELVDAYEASSELGLNFRNIKLELLHTQGLLHASQEMDVSKNRSLHSLLEEHSKKADEAEDMLDELHYFMIQDKLDGTKEATVGAGGGLQGHAFHVRHALHHTTGNWLSCFSCSHTQDDDSAVAATSNKHITKLSAGSNDGGAVDDNIKRVVISNKFKSAVEEMNKICLLLPDLHKTASTPVTLKRHPTSSIVGQDKTLYGRSDIFYHVINALTGGTYHYKSLSVLPFVGPGGIGKTTLTKHIYNDKRIEKHFPIRVWICVSTDFDVIKLTQEILSCIRAAENEQNTDTTQTTNLERLQRSIIERLKFKHFLIVLDDIWRCNSESNWESLLAPFTMGETKGNMVLVTTRFPSIADLVKTTDPVELCRLRLDDLFALFEACIFGDNESRLHEGDLVNVARLHSLASRVPFAECHLFYTRQRGHITTGSTYIL